MLAIGSLGINFKTADLSLREMIARGAASLSGERAIFFHHPVVVLSTCNRTEIYFAAEDLALAHSDLLAYLRTQIEVDFEHRLYSYFGIDCFSHLCRVTAGLDSAIFAETEIQRQVKIAYGARSRNLPSTLHYVFQKSLKVAKLIRNQLDLVKGSPSLYGTLWQLAKWRNQKVLLVGYSEINRGLISFLLHKGVENITLCSRSSIEIGGLQICDRSGLADWQSYDVIVAASQADTYLIQGRGLGQVIFDLGVPRNVDPEVGKSTRLYNIDQLGSTGAKANHMDWCDALIRENVSRLSRLYLSKTQHALESEEMELHL